jgi:hypothetical protein
LSGRWPSPTSRAPGEAPAAANAATPSPSATPLCPLHPSTPFALQARPLHRPVVAGQDGRRGSHDRVGLRGAGHHRQRDRPQPAQRLLPDQRAAGAHGRQRRRQCCRGHGHRRAAAPVPAPRHPSPNPRGPFSSACCRLLAHTLHPARCAGWVYGPVLAARHLLGRLFRPLVAACTLFQATRWGIAAIRNRCGRLPLAAAGSWPAPAHPCPSPPPPRPGHARRIKAAWGEPRGGSSSSSSSHAAASGGGGRRRPVTASCAPPATHTPTDAPPARRTPAGCQTRRTPCTSSRTAAPSSSWWPRSSCAPPPAPAALRAALRASAARAPWRRCWRPRRRAQLSR